MARRRVPASAASLLALAATLLVLASPAPASAAEPARHSGRVVRIGLDLSRIVIEETVAWNVEGAAVVRRSIRITPHTAIHLLERRAAAGSGHLDRFGWSATTIPAAELREGDFVTVTTGIGAGGRATALQVVRPDGD